MPALCTGRAGGGVASFFARRDATPSGNRTKGYLGLPQARRDRLSGKKKTLESDGSRGLLSDVTCFNPEKLLLFESP